MEVINSVRMLSNSKFPFLSIDSVSRETLNMNVMGFCGDCLSYLKSDRMLIFFYTNGKMFGTELIESLSNLTEG